MRDTALSPQDSEKVTVRFGVDVPNFTTSRAVGIDENKINSLELWVFDKDGHFLERAKAENVTKTSENLYTYTFEAKMTPAPDGCVIHFVANKSLGEDAKVLTLTGKNESDVLFSVDGTSDGKLMTMWGRHTYDKVEKDTNLGNVEVLRNMVKFGLEITSEATNKLKDVTYALYRTMDKGSIAPFDPTDKQFTEGFITEPAGTSFYQPKEGVDWKTPGEFHYGYERKNADAEQIACLIIKGTYQSDSKPSYYKIDFVDAKDKTKRYDLTRNHFYKVTINDVLERGYSTVAEALSGLSANNKALSEEIQSFPTFSDGKGKLEVDKTLYVIVDENTKEFTFNVKYFPDYNKVDTKNQDITVSVIEGGNAVTEATASNGTITVKLNNFPTGGVTYAKSDLVLGVKGQNDLKRLVRVVLRTPYDYTTFTANESTDLTNVQVKKQQNSDLRINMTLPDDEFIKRLLPLRFRVYTENFYPVGGQGFQFGRKGNKTFYEVQANSTTLDYNFKSNKSNSAETIKVECVEGYFKEKNVQITNSNW